MPLYIKDEAANALLLTIDNNGLIAFGNGAPVNQFTVNGTAVIDADGNISGGRVGSGAIAAESGTVSVGPGQSVVVNTMSGVRPHSNITHPSASGSLCQHPDLHDTEPYSKDLHRELPRVQHHPAQ
jgi:hypothetical protein